MENVKEAKELDLLNVLDSFTRKAGDFKYNWKNLLVEQSPSIKCRDPFAMR